MVSKRYWVKHIQRIQSNKCPRTAADLTCPKAYLFFPQNLIRCLINILLILNLNISRSCKQHCSFTFPGYRNNSVLLHFSAFKVFSYSDLSNLSHKVPTQKNHTMAGEAQDKTSHLLKFKICLFLAFQEWKSDPPDGYCTSNYLVFPVRKALAGRQ